MIWCARRALAGLCVMLLPAAMASAQDAPSPAWSWKSGALELDGTLETYSAFYSMRGTWWNLAAESAPDFDMDRSFAELWVHPKLDGRYELG